MDVALRLSYQTPLLLSTFMKCQEVSVSQKKVGPLGHGVGEQVPMQSNIYISVLPCTVPIFKSRVMTQYVSVAHIRSDVFFIILHHASKFETLTLPSSFTSVW